jgi:hypothetical protein
VADFCDEHVASWLDGADPIPEPLPAWFAGYQGRGHGAVTREGFVEPYLGGRPVPRSSTVSPWRGFTAAMRSAAIGVNHGSATLWYTVAIESYDIQLDAGEDWFMSPILNSVGPAADARSRRSRSPSVSR